MAERAEELINQLADCWLDWKAYSQFALRKYAPTIVRLDSSIPLIEKEQDLVARLRVLLSDDEWKRLPKLLASEIRCKIRGLLQFDFSGNNYVEQYGFRAEARRREQEAEASVAQIVADRIERIMEVKAARKMDLRTQIAHWLETDYLTADINLSKDPDATFLNEKELAKLKSEFVHDWAYSELDLPLDLEQAAAVGATNGNILVTARAGSGKTRTLVTRAVFLQKHCGISPDEILLLAFNKKAAEEMEERLVTLLGNKDIPHVMTFHALAYAIVHPEETLVSDNLATEERAQTKLVQDVIDNQIESEELGPRIKDLMLTYFLVDWEKIKNGKLDLTEFEHEELLNDRRMGLTRETLKGEYVKSFGEKLIANTLFENSVRYRYESNWRWDDVNYRPDFKIGNKKGVIIEYFGITGDPEYDEMSREKREYWNKNPNWTLIEIYPSDIKSRSNKGFEEFLISEINKAGISSKKLSEEEVWELVKVRAFDRLSNAITSFIRNCRKQNLSPDDLSKKLLQHATSNDAEEQFLSIGKIIYEDYTKRLEDEEKDDFDGLLWRAIQCVHEGNSSFVRRKGRERGDLKKIRYIHIDEYQDFSLPFYELIEAIRTINKKVQLFCVGDDWQAINAFAGSDLKYFNNFDKNYSGSKQLCIRTNYRSPKQIVEFGNSVMRGLGLSALTECAEQGIVWKCDVDEFVASDLESFRHAYDPLTPALLRIISYFLRGDDKNQVVMLSRTNGPPWSIYVDDGVKRDAKSLEGFLKQIRSFFPDEDRKRISASTVHKFKGLEHQSVIILDAISGRYPLIHPMWAFNRIFGDTVSKIVDEERRLFYVAATRAAQDLALIISDSARTTPFIETEEDRDCFTAFSWEKLPPVSSDGFQRLAIKILGGFDVKDELRDLGFVYKTGKGGGYWYKVVKEDDLSIDDLKAQPWAKGKVIMVCTADKDEILNTIEV
jgi:DNA helicase-4